jgi:hypothetical protein
VATDANELLLRLAELARGPRAAGDFTRT